MPGSPTPARGWLVLVLAATLLTAGCTLYEGSSSGETNDPEGVRQAEDCTAEPVEDDRSSGAQVSCLNAEGADRHRQAFDCPDPDRSAVSLAANLTAGALSVAIEDADGTVVFEQVYEEQGEFEDRRDIDEGAQGEWALIVDRNEELEGAFGIRAACAR